ncbi:hypothetical protein BpHYR1_045013 [Brachionus plicatilis]|uniref:RNA-directed DNA polymerase from mobile element jockey-like n=1 Tax=Brachionus plicatilis TaxID=10195 RepID=A0A3M7PVJ9_BRAPC|nr:hypothetical protein BpHYR1_045013 [Brachionus plicatilis]
MFTTLTFMKLCERNADKIGLKLPFVAKIISITKTFSNYDSILDIIDIFTFFNESFSKILPTPLGKLTFKFRINYLFIKYTYLCKLHSNHFVHQIKPNLNQNFTTIATARLACRGVLHERSPMKWSNYKDKTKNLLDLFDNNKNMYTLPNELATYFFKNKIKECSLSMKALLVERRSNSIVDC